MTDFPIRYSQSVQAALDEERPVVALESTIITHGMPWPQNVETARKVEDAVRESGAIPATIAIMDGAIHVGLTDEQLDSLGQAQDVMKLSRADFAFAISQGRTGSTTVAATMIVAAMAGIRVFATGGIGGVHRGAEASFDISADLKELSQSPVTVVCAGAKAILDIPKTLEVLETLGVPVISYRSDDFPAFWSRKSGLPSPLRLDSPQDIARHDKARQGLGMSGGTLVANPVPEKDEIVKSEIDRHITDALNAANEQNVSGKNVTPFLLGKIVDLSEGRSLVTNMSLIINNAHLAAEIAVQYQNM